MLAALASFHLVLKCSSAGDKMKMSLHIFIFKEERILPVVWCIMQDLMKVLKLAPQQGAFCASATPLHGGIGSVSSEGIWRWSGLP